MKNVKGKILTALLAITLLTLPATFTSCGTTPATRAVQVSDSAKVTVEAALGAWDAYIVANHPPVNQQIAVKAAWQKYQAAQILVLDTALILKEAQTTGVNTPWATAALNSAIANAGTTLADLLALLRQCGVKL